MAEGWDELGPWLGYRAYAEAYVQGLLDGVKFKQTAYAVDRKSRKAALSHFLKKVAEDPIADHEAYRLPHSQELVPKTGAADRWRSVDVVETVQSVSRFSAR